jgi:hypothetical protein
LVFKELESLLICILPLPKDNRVFMLELTILNMKNVNADVCITLFAARNGEEMLDRMSGKLSRTVLRQGKGNNPFSLVDYTAKKVVEQVADYGWKQIFSRVGKPSIMPGVKVFSLI